MEAGNVKDGLASWAVFNGWEPVHIPTVAPLSPDWWVFDDLFAAYSAVTDGYYTEFDKLIEQWDGELMAAGGHYAELYDTYFRHQSLQYIEREAALSA
jgi:hypothetical protein